MPSGPYDTNLGSPNNYWRVVEPFDVWVSLGFAPSNQWYGAAQISFPNLKRVRAEPGDEIHHLHGGVFFVPRDTRKALPCYAYKQEFGAGAYMGGPPRHKYPLNKMEEINKNEALRGVSYKSASERLSALALSLYHKAQGV